MNWNSTLALKMEIGRSEDAGGFWSKLSMYRDLRLKSCWSCSLKLLAGRVDRIISYSNSLKVSVPSSLNLNESLIWTLIECQTSARACALRWFDSPSISWRPLGAIHRRSRKLEGGVWFLFWALQIPLILTDIVWMAGVVGHTFNTVLGLL